jgi:AMIN domain-containing protein
MLRLKHIFLFLFFVPAAAAQSPADALTEISGLNVSGPQQAEVLVELSSTGAAPDAKVVATCPDSLILDLPGAVYHALPRRVPVNRAGVRAVRLWMQSENPPLTRVAIELDATEHYLLSVEGNAVVLRIGPDVLGASTAVPLNIAEIAGNRTAAPAARGSVSTSVARALVGIFKHGPRKSPGHGSSKSRNGQPAKPDDTSTQTAQTSNAGQVPPPQEVTTSAAGLDAASLPTTNENPAAKGLLNATASPGSGETAKPPYEPALGSQDSSSAQAASRNPVVSNSFPQPVFTVAPSESSSASSSSTSEQKTSSAAASVVPPAEVPPASAPEAAPPPTVDSSLPESSSSNVTTEAHPVDIPTPVAPSDATPENSSASTGSRQISAAEMNALAAVANPGMRTEFHVKYVQQETAYLDGGRSAGLAEGMKLVVKNEQPASQVGANSEAASGPAAELVVVAVAETSAVAEIRIPKRDIVAGDVAYLSSEDIQALVQQNALGATRKYPAVITFSEGGDALDEEAHAFVPRPPLPSVNRAAGRFGFNYSGTKSNDASQMSSSSIGGVLQADFTRIAGTYWNFRGYWRGTLTSSASVSQPTLQDLINRTYHLNLSYDNPNSRWLLGAGRLYLPWASSLETLDGGYFAARTGHGTTIGLFGGSTPDPTSWNYNPNRHIGGVFFNAEGGSYDQVHYSSTTGIGKSFDTVQYSTTTPTGTTLSSYQDNRPFAFLENTLSYKRIFSIFDALQADRPSGNPAVPAPTAGISRSFLTARLQPVSRVEFSLNHTYFRDIPTFDPQLVGTGLLDKYLFQGFSGGVRVEVIKNIALYTDLGRSSRSGDAKTSLNQMYGITFMNVPKLQLHADFHYSRFTGSFGSGTYRAFSLSRSLRDDFHFELLAGDQAFTSTLAGNQNAKFVTTNMDTSLGALFFLQGGVTFYRGQLQNYNQWNVTLGYRFDSKWRRK